MSVPHLDIQIGLGEEEVQVGSAAVVTAVRPAWPAEAIQWRTFTDGITNKLVGASCGDRADTVLVRVYGHGTDKIIDRAAEVENMRLLQEFGLASARLYATFQNGLCYEFLAGRVADCAAVQEPDVARAVAAAMAALHSVPLPRPGPALLFLRLERFAEVAGRPTGRLGKDWLSPDDLQAELVGLRGLLGTAASPVVFCHNDALLANIIIRHQPDHPTSMSVAFIDLEYAGPNYAAFDIANHFCEFVGCEGELDYPGLLPTREYQLAWLKRYIQEAGLPAEQLDTIYEEVQQFMLAAHLLWSVWSVIQAANSSIDFDFVEYALQRLKEYRRWKAKLGVSFSLDANQ